MDFELTGRSFGFLDPYLIAEIGVNHEGDLDRAKRMIDQVAKAGGHAAKFQTYRADKLAAKNTSPAYWDTSKEKTLSQFELFQKYDGFGPEEYKALAEHCDKVGVDFLSTPFDLEAVEYLAPLMPLIKIASADLTNIPLIRAAGKTGKPLLMSVGASSHDEIRNSIRAALDAGAEKVSIMHCVLNYPTPHDRAQLGQIKTLQQLFGDQLAVGYSDHVAPEADGTMPALEMASLFGATVIEKHFTDDRSAPGNDHYHAMDESGLAAFTKKLAQYREILGSGELDLSTQQSAISNARRRIIASRDLLPGEVIGEGDLIALRSNVGIEIAQFDDVVGRRVAKLVESGNPLVWEQLEP